MRNGASYYTQHSARNKALFLLFGLFLSIVCPFLVPLYFYWRASNNSADGDGIGSGGFQFTIVSVAIIFILTILLWVPGVVAALVYANYVGLPIANRYYHSM